jgi:hypothetical protein
LGGGRRTIGLFHQNNLKQRVILPATCSDTILLSGHNISGSLSTEPLINQVRLKVLTTDRIYEDCYLLGCDAVPCSLTEVYRNSPTLTFVLITASITTNPINEQPVISELVYRGRVL